MSRLIRRFTNHPHCLFSTTIVKRTTNSNNNNNNKSILSHYKSQLSNNELASMDSLAEQAEHFHAGGLEATHRVASFGRLGSHDRVMDIGSGLGGPALVMAQSYGCNVLGVDVMHDFVSYARRRADRLLIHHNAWLTHPVNNSDCGKVWFETISTLEDVIEKFPNARRSFSACVLMHVMMHFEDKKRLLKLIRDQFLLPNNGRLVLYEIFLGQNGQNDNLNLPVPFASQEGTFWLQTMEKFINLAVDDLDMKLLHERDATGDVASWVKNQLRKPHQTSGYQDSMKILLGNSGEKSRNMMRNLQDERLKVMEIVLQIS